jgi:hypothetical protein
VQRVPLAWPAEACPTNLASHTTSLPLLFCAQCHAPLPGRPPPPPPVLRPSDEIAAEISSEFHLSDTDRDICAAALKEWLDRGMDQQQRR